MIRYKVKSVKFRKDKWEFSYNKELFIERRENFIGACNVKHHKIFVEPTLPMEKAVEVLKHELTHAYVFSCVNQMLAFNEKFCEVINQYWIDWESLKVEDIICDL